MDTDGPDPYSSSAMDRQGLAALALVDDGIEPTFEALNAWMVDRGFRSVDYPIYDDWAWVQERSATVAGEPGKIRLSAQPWTLPQDRRMQKV